MATLMFPDQVRKNSTSKRRNYAWPSVDSCSGFRLFTGL